MTSLLLPACELRDFPATDQAVAQIRPGRQRGRQRSDGRRQDRPSRQCPAQRRRRPDPWSAEYGRDAHNNGWQVAKRNNAHLSFGVPVDRAGQRDVSRAWRDGFYDQVADHPKWTYWQARLAGWDNVQNYLFARRCGQEWAQEVGGLSSHGREGQQAMDALSAFHALPSEANWYALGEAVGAMRKAVRRTDVPAPFTNPADEETSVSEREVVPEPAQAEMAGQGVAGSALSGDAAARPAAADTRTEWAVRFISRSSGYEFLAECANETAARGEAENPTRVAPPGAWSSEVVCSTVTTISSPWQPPAGEAPAAAQLASLVHTAAETLRHATGSGPLSSEAAAAVADRLQLALDHIAGIISPVCQRRAPSRRPPPGRGRGPDRHRSPPDQVSGTLHRCHDDHRGRVSVTRSRPQPRIRDAPRRQEPPARCSCAARPG